MCPLAVVGGFARAHGRPDPYTATLPCACLHKNSPVCVPAQECCRALACTRIHPCVCVSPCGRGHRALKNPQALVFFSSLPVKLKQLMHAEGGGDASTPADDGAADLLATPNDAAALAAQNEGAGTEPRRKPLDV